MEAYPNKIDSYLNELKDRSRAAISAFGALENSGNQVSLKLCVQKFLNECEGISSILWSNNNKRLRKHIRNVLSISSDSPLSSVAFCRLKDVIKELNRTGNKPKDKVTERTLTENTGVKGTGHNEDTAFSSAFSYNPVAKIFIIDGQSYEFLPLFLAVRDLYATLPFFKELQQCTEMLEKDPEDATALFQKSVLLYKARRFETALQINSEVLEESTADFRVWYNRGVILAEIGRLAEALEAYNRAIELEPAFEISWDNKGVVLARLGRFEEALETYEKVLLRNPGYAEAWAGKAAILSSMGRKEEAVEAYNQALKIRPDYLEALKGTANLLSLVGRFEEALTAYDRAVQLAPKEPALWAGRSLVLLELHRYKEALKDCNKALELRPGFAPALEIKIRVISEISRNSGSPA